MAETLEIEENIIQVEITEPVKKRVLRSAPWRHNADGTYNKRPIDEKYYYNYFKEHHHHPIQCELCDRVLKCCDGLKRHQKTTICQKYRLIKENAENL